MSEYYIGEIRMMLNINGRCQYGWLLCDGSLKNISEYQTLFSLIGTTYGGDGVQTFAVPDLRGRLPVGQGTGAGLTARTVGQYIGSETATVPAAALPVHTHTFNSINTTATTPTVAATNSGSVPVGFANTTAPTIQYMKNGFTAAEGATVSLAEAMVDTTGVGAAHSNVMPCATVNYIIAWYGMYPQRAN